LVATGVDYLTTVEIINLDPSNPGLVCENLPEFPVGIEGGTGQLFHKRTPIICGGAKANRWVDSCDCYSFQHQTWTQISSLNQCRRYTASSLVSLQHDKEVLMMAGGGMEWTTPLKSVESFDGTDWEQGQLSELPNEVWLHCLVKINSTTLLLIGGKETGSRSTARTHFFHADKNQWIPGPTLNKVRHAAGCGVLNWMNPQTNQMEKIVVAAGGADDGYFFSETELLYVDRISDNIWIMGPSLPLGNALPSMVEFQNSVILIGGGYPNGSKDLYQLTTPGVNVIRHFLCH
jgi:hypothetical protein